MCSNAAGKQLVCLTFVLSLALSAGTAVYGQSTFQFSDLSPVAVSANTGEKPQSKVWFYDGSWWAAFPDGQGTYIWKLSGLNWTRLLKISDSSSNHADVKVVNSVVHILLFRSGGSTEVVSVEYDSGTKIYNLWPVRPHNISLQLDSGVETATLDIDSAQRMWIASDGQNEIYVRWSDPPYDVWSAPIRLDGSVTTDDICAVTSMPDQQVAVLWSNQSSKRFGFALHKDSRSPDLGQWLIEKVPFFSSSSCSSSNMADDHINLAVGSDGTLFAAVKTSFDQSGCPKVALLIRRPLGAWEMHEVDGAGTRPIVLLNEPLNTLWVVYTSVENGGQILYRESAISHISFSGRKTLIGGVFNDATSTKQNFTDEIVVLASDDTWIVGVHGQAGGYYLNLTTVGQGSVASNPQGDVYPPGTTVALTALPASGWTFDNWSGDAAGTANPISVLIDGQKDVTAHFAQITFSLSPNSATVTGGDSLQGTVTLSNAAPAGGAVIALSSGDPALATLPALVTVAAGKTSATFMVTTMAVSAQKAVTITASYGGMTQTAQLTLMPVGSTIPSPPPSVILISPQHQSVTNTASVTFTASASAAAGLASATLNLEGSQQSVVFSGAQQVQDAQITASQPALNMGGSVTINVDGGSSHAHALVKFPTLIGSAAGQVPSGSAIASATLRLNCTNSGNMMWIYRLTEDWVENEATWSSRANGVNWTVAGADGGGSNAGVALNGDCTATGLRSIDITRFVQEWSSGSPNYGIVLIDTGTNGVDFSSSESSSSPNLTVVYQSPRQAVQTKLLAGTNATVDFLVTLPAGVTYFWNVLVTDQAGQQSWAPLDFELTIPTGSGTGRNAAPVAANQSVSTMEDSPVPIVLSATDTDGDLLTYMVISGPAKGTLSGTPPNLMYQPTLNYSGSDSFTFSATDGIQDSSVATVTITVQPVNDPPIAVDNAYSLTQGNTLNVSAPGILGNDSDIDSTALRSELATGPSNGSLTLNTDGSFSYTPNVGFSGTDSFVYRTSDGALSNSATVTLTIQPSGATPPSATGLQNPTANASVTSSAGDNNGFQTSPANAYAPDGLFAVDTNSGTGTSTSCTSSSKDKHLFYNYGFSIPQGATIRGIEVRLGARVDSTSGSPKFCVQLSWNGGASWTAAKSTARLSTSAATYLLGSGTDTWGQTWTVDNLTDASFRVRVISVASSTSRDFSLDWVGVRVSY